MNSLSVPWIWQTTFWLLRELGIDRDDFYSKGR